LTGSIRDSPRSRTLPARPLISRLPAETPTATASSSPPAEIVAGGRLLDQRKCTGRQILTEDGWQTITKVELRPWSSLYVHTEESDHPWIRSTDQLADGYLAQVRPRPIYGMNKMGYVETQWDGEPLTTLSAARSYADTVDGKVYVSHDNGQTWEPWQPHATQVSPSGT
jgi:hypothetical protein